MQGRAQLGGALLRRAFLGIEAAVTASLDVEALWDCCLAVPQLVLTTGWTDMLAIFSRYLHQYAHIKLSPNHPLTIIAASLHTLSRQTTINNAAAAAAANWQLSAYVSRAWSVWIDSLTRLRGRYDDVTIHLKRGYVTLIDPRHAMAGDIIGDFGHAVRGSLAARGAAATTGRILELENLLVRMFVPLFTAEMARTAEEMLGGVVGKVGVGEYYGDWDESLADWGSPRDGGVTAMMGGGGGKGYTERYLLFSANYFMAAIAEYNGEGDKARWYRQRSLDSPRDLFWLQTASLVESTLRAEGKDGEANAIREARAEAQAVLLGLGEVEAIAY
jgi:hypothetical protein